MNEGYNFTEFIYDELQYMISETDPSNWYSTFTGHENKRIVKLFNLQPIDGASSFIIQVEFEDGTVDTLNTWWIKRK